MLGPVIRQFKQSTAFESRIPSGFARAEDLLPQAFERVAQRVVFNPGQALIERRMLRRVERARRGGGAPRVARQRPLHQSEAGHRAVAEKSVDALENLRLTVLRDQSEGGLDARAQRAVLALPPGEAEFLRHEVPRQILADDGWPLGDELGLAEATLAEHRPGDGRQIGGQRAHAAAPVRAEAGWLVRGRWLVSHVASRWRAWQDKAWLRPRRFRILRSSCCRRGSWPGTTVTAESCPGARVPARRRIPIASGSARSCCSRPLWRRSDLISPTFWHAGPTSPQWSAPPSTTCCMPGRGWAITHGPATCMLARETSRHEAAASPTPSRVCARCPASAPIPRRRLPPSPSVTRPRRLTAMPSASLPASRR